MHAFCELYERLKKTIASTAGTHPCIMYASYSFSPLPPPVAPHAFCGPFPPWVCKNMFLILVYKL